MTALPGFNNNAVKPSWGASPQIALADIEWGMTRAWFGLAIIIATATAGHAAPEASVRLDFPPGYFSAQPTAAPQKASSTSAQDDCTSNCVNFDDGYAWAQARSFKAEEQCRGRSRAFVEGCMIYVTESRKCGGSCR
jgi:hypothetical protein